jgi:hypothetical protein
MASTMLMPTTLVNLFQTPWTGAMSPLLMGKSVSQTPFVLRWNHSGRKIQLGLIWPSSQSPENIFCPSWDFNEYAGNEQKEKSWGKKCDPSITNSIHPRPSGLSGELHLINQSLQLIINTFSKASFLTRGSESKLGFLWGNTARTFLQVCIIIFFFFVGLVFELFRICKAALLQLLYQLSHTSSSFCSGYFGDGCLVNCLPGLASNLSPPNLSSPSSYDYRRPA